MIHIQNILPIFISISIFMKNALSDDTSDKQAKSFKYNNFRVVMKFREMKIVIYGTVATGQTVTDGIIYI